MAAARILPTHACREALTRAFAITTIMYYV